jgi:ribosomal protein S18 acetylase RimI-like enzyme
MTAPTEIAALDGAQATDAVEALAQVLHACVLDGASVGFNLPFHLEEARAFWTGVAAAVATGRRVLFVARHDGTVVGTAQLSLETMPNQRHRGEVCKVLVHPDARRRGVARDLMAAVEAEALRAGLSLLTLDTRTGDAAEPLYLSLGYQVVGQIPGYALAPEGGALDATTVMYKVLATG